METEIWKNLSIEDIPGEEWRDVFGYEGKYQVSNMGRVKSLNYRRTGKAQIMEQNEVRGGYLKVNLCKNGKIDQSRVHRLVAIAFIPNPNNLPEVNHKDENIKNNIVSNLEWCNPKYNINYGNRNERVSIKLLNRKDLSKPVLCVETGIVYDSANEASRHTGANQGNIISCCRGKYGYKTVKGYHWQYYVK
jgi:hypothetical protein